MAQLQNLLVTGDSRFLNEINGKIDWSNVLSKPTIPAAANNGTLTIQKNGTNVQTFTANQSTNVTANITVPTKVSELTNDSGYTSNIGTVTQVKVGTTAYNPSSGVVTLPAYPTSLPASNTTSTYSATGTAPVNGTAVAAALATLPEPMVFKGSLGTGGTITALPTNGTANVGDTYKVITAGTYASKAADVGDIFICLTKTSSANTWELIPSGDEPSGTVTSVTIKATSPIAIDSSSAITTSGTRTLSHANSGVTAGTYRSVTVNATGHVTAGTNPTTISGYGITDAKISNGVITLGSNTITPLTSFTETDPTVPDWAKAETKPTYTAAEVGLGNVGNFKAVSTVASQGLTDTEKSNARANIGAGTSSLTLGTSSTTAAKGNHTHTTTIATSTGTNQITLAHGGKYSITAGGTSYIFTMPSSGNTDTYTTAYCSTAAATAAKVATCTGYVLTSGHWVHVTMTNANSASSALTLNINSTGAKTIYIDGTASSSSNKTLPAGTYLVYYDGTNYYFRTDGYLGKPITVGSASSWSAGSVPSMTKSNVTAKSVKTWSAGSVPTLGTAISADDITAWTANTPTAVTLPTYTVDSNGCLNITSGSVTAGKKANLSYTSRSIPNVTSVGTAPSLTTEDKTATYISAWSAGTAPSLTISNTTVTTGKGA